MLRSNVGIFTEHTYGFERWEDLRPGAVFDEIVHIGLLTKIIHLVQFLPNLMSLLDLLS